MTARPSEGKFIVFDGADGAGKSTQVRMLHDALVARGHKVHMTFEPSTWPIGVMIRSYLQHKQTEGVPGWQAMALLFAADRMQHLEHEVLPSLARGEIVLCDRYVASSLAYQSAVRGEDVEEQDRALHWISTLNAEAARPDLTLLFDLDPEVAATRRAARAGVEELLERVDLQRRVRVQYGKVPRMRPNDRFAHIDASPDADSVHRAVLAAVDAVFASRTFLASPFFDKFDLYERALAIESGPALTTEGCTHPMPAWVTFDVEAAKGLTVAEIRRRWPRYDGPCPKCGMNVIHYASTAHYIDGDW
jgi:dTMP kinase